jgi:hypothetical protein
VNPAQTTAVALAGVWAAGTGLLSLLAPRDHQDDRPRWSWAVVLLVLADLLAAHVLLNPPVRLELYQAPSPQAAQMEALAGGERLFLNKEDEYALKFERFFLFDTFDPGEDWLNLRKAPLPNLTLLDGLPSANNFDPLVPARYARWMKFLAGADPAVLDRLLPRMGVGLVERADTAQPDGVSYKRVESQGRVRWVPCALRVNEVEEAFQKVTSEENTLSFSQTFVMVEGLTEPEGGECIPEDRGQAKITNENPNLLEVEIQAPSPGWLVVADTWFPGWTVELDREQAPILRADYLFRAVAVPQGTHTVVFRYRPVSFGLGAAISLLAGALLGFWGLPHFRRKGSVLPGQ